MNFQPIKNLDIQFYKRMNESNGPMSYGIKIKIIESQVEYSGDYIFHSLGQPTEKVTIYVFAESKDEIQLKFIDLHHPCDAGCIEEPSRSPALKTHFA